MSIAPWWCAIIIAAKSRSASPLYPVPIDRCIVAIAWFISAANELPLAKAAVEIAHDAYRWAGDTRWLLLAMDAAARRTAASMLSMTGTLQACERI